MLEKIMKIEAITYMIYASVLQASVPNINHNMKISMLSFELYPYFAGFVNNHRQKILRCNNKSDHNIHPDWNSLHPIDIRRY